MRSVMDRDGLLFVVLLAGSAAALVGTDLAFLPGLALLVAAASALWLVSLALGNAGIVDVFWGPGFVLVGDGEVRIPLSARKKIDWIPVLVVLAIGFLVGLAVRSRRR